ncbi:MAG: sulfatase [Planctomycetota bacterium]
MSAPAAWLALLACSLAALSCGGEPGTTPAAGTAPSSAGVAEPAAPAARPDYSRANLVILSLDTLRADFTTMGGVEGLTPELARFAAQGTVFRHARSQSPHTAPSHMSIFTSTYPSVHGVQNVAHKKNEQGVTVPEIYPLREDIPTLAQVLKAAGFATQAITDGGNLNPPHGFPRGFDSYESNLEGVEVKVGKGLAALRAMSAPGAPRSFLFWHTYQVHAPYVPPAKYIETWAPKSYTGVMKERIAQLGELDFKQRFGLMKDLFWKDKESFGWNEAAYLRGLYSGGVRYTDDQLAQLMQALNEPALADNTIVVLLADHGEEFFEHGKWQHDQLFEECLRVPLVVRLPGGRGAGQVIDTPVSLLDVMPTVLELLAVDTAKLELPGRVRQAGLSLLPALLEGRRLQDRVIFSEHIATTGLNYEQNLVVHANGLKFHYDEIRGERLPDGSVRHLRALFDLAQDPGELTDLAGKLPERVAFFEDQRTSFRRIVELEGLSDVERAQAVVSDEEMEELRQLGYVGGDEPGSR